MYAPIELGQEGNEKCPDAYNEASTRLVPGCKRLYLQTSKQAVFVQLGIFREGHQAASLGSIQWLSEDPWLPVIASLGRNFDAVRVRNFTKGKEAQVLISFVS